MKGQRRIQIPEMAQFYRRLRARDLPVEKLAEIIGCSRPALTRVLTGARRRGPIWERAIRFLGADEIALLDVAQRSLWNTRRIEKRPHWDAAKLQKKPAAAASVA